MKFENDYNAFCNAVLMLDVEKAENIISQSDEKKVYLENAIDHFGEYRITLVSQNFRSSGLKRIIDGLVND